MTLKFLIVTSPSQLPGRGRSRYQLLNKFQYSLSLSITGWSLARPGDRRRLALCSPASGSPRIVPVDAAACRAYRDPGVETTPKS